MCFALGLRPSALTYNSKIIPSCQAIFPSYFDQKTAGQTPGGWSVFQGLLGIFDQAEASVISTVDNSKCATVILIAESKEAMLQ